MMAWTAVADGLPDDETTVLIATEDGEVWTGFMDGGQWRYVSADPVGIPVTHWMHFPSPPILVAPAWAADMLKGTEARP